MKFLAATGQSAKGMADTFRRLADQTASATLDIESTVRQMQGAVSGGVMEMDRFREQVRRGVQSAGYEVTDDYWTAISHLEHGRSVALQIAGELPRELFDLVNQYNARRGIVQVLEQPSLKIRLVQLDPLASRLLLVMANEDEAPNSERYQGRLLEAVGIVTRV